MSNSERLPPRRPLLVQLGLWGLPNRAWALGFMWLCGGLAAISLVFRFWAGTPVMLAALWYWYSIRWVDNHDSWK